MSHLCWYACLIFWFDILHSVAELNKASYCIAANSDYLEVFAVWIVMMLRAKTENNHLELVYKLGNLFVFEPFRPNLNGMVYSCIFVSQITK